MMFKEKNIKKSLLPDDLQVRPFRVAKKNTDASNLALQTQLRAGGTIDCISMDRDQTLQCCRDHGKAEIWSDNSSSVFGPKYFCDDYGKDYESGDWD